MQHFLQHLPAALALVALLASGCGDDDGPSEDRDAATADAAPAVDSDPGPALGRACSGEGQGDCPGGFRCIAFGPHRWCSKPCGDRATGTVDHATCAEGYDAAGSPQCMLVGVGGPEEILCGIACAEDEPGTLCTNASCDGECPGELECDTEVAGGAPGMMCR